MDGTPNRGNAWTLNGESFRTSQGRRDYDKRYQGRDIEFKSDDFSKGQRSQAEIERIKKQIQKDIELKNNGEANPHWHFDHDPTQADEMAPLLRQLEENGIPWTAGQHPPILT